MLMFFSVTPAFLFLVTGGAIQVTLRKIMLDYYPTHKAGTYSSAALINDFMF